MTRLSTIARGDGSRITDRRRALVRSPEEWTALWAAHAGPDAAPPAVDFTTSTIAAAFAGQRPSPGYTIEIAGALEEDGGTRLLVEERPPAPGTVAAQILTSPFHIVALPRASGEIRWSEPRAAGAQRPAAPAQVAKGRSRRTTTGLRPRTAGALAYLAGPFSGAFMLFAEPSNAFVRFHAWQSIIGLGALIAALLACYVLAFASLFFSANGIALMMRASIVVAAVLVIVCAVCIWKAWSGRAWKLPVAGRWAERLAARTPAGER